MALPTNPGSNDGEKKPSGGLPLPSPSERESGPVGYPAPRGGLPTPGVAPRRPLAPMPAPPEDDPFEQLSPEDAIDETEIYEDPVRVEEVEEPVEYEEAPAPTPAPTHQDPVVMAPPVAPEELDSEESSFINEKKKKLLPFGGAKSDGKRGNKTDASAFDSREDRRTKARIVQIGVLTLLTGLVGLGVYSVVSPDQGVTAEQVNNAIAQAVTNEGFPEDRGSAFASSFIGTYLTATGADDQKEELLGYYYTGVLGGGTSTESTATYSDVTQRILVAPQVYSYSLVSTSTAAYEVGALVEVLPSDPEALAELEASGESAPTKWVYYNVNVYYDEATDALAVTPDSPSLIPPPNFAAADAIPEPKTLGTGETSDELEESIQSSVHNYFSAFAQASPLNHEMLDNLVVGGPAAGPELLKGMGGQFRLAGSPSEAISYDAYVGEDSTDASPQVKAEVTVIWEDASLPEDGAQITYTSTYYVQLIPASGEGQWLVATIAPRYYLVGGA